VRFVVAGILVAVRLDVSVFAKVPDPHESVRSLEHRFRIADIGSARIAPSHHDRLILAVAFDRVDQYPDRGGPGLSVPQLDGMRQRLASGVEEPDVRSVGLRLFEIEAALVEQYGQWIARDIFRHIRAGGCRVDRNRPGVAPDVGRRALGAASRGRWLGGLQCASTHRET
jgi:hypothetical protein